MGRSQLPLSVRAEHLQAKASLSVPLGPSPPTDRLRLTPLGLRGSARIGFDPLELNLLFLLLPSFLLQSIFSSINLIYEVIRLLYAERGLVAPVPNEGLKNPFLLREDGVQVSITYSFATEPGIGI